MRFRDIQLWDKFTVARCPKILQNNSKGPLKISFGRGIVVAVRPPILDISAKRAWKYVLTIFFRGIWDNKSIFGVVNLLILWNIKIFLSYTVNPLKIQIWPSAESFFYNTFSQICRVTKVRDLAIVWFTHNFVCLPLRVATATMSSAYCHLAPMAMEVSMSVHCCGIWQKKFTLLASPQVRAQDKRGRHE